MRQRALTFSATLLIALAVTLGLKAAVTDYSVGDDSARFASDLQATLRGQGFAVALDPTAHLATTIIARRGACRLQARDGTRAYELSDVFAARYGKRERITYFLDGRVTPTPPALGSESLNIIQRTVARFGLGFSRPATIAVIDNGACDVGRLHFDTVRIYSRSGRS